MSLRFLKAKPKLTLSKDNKIRSVPKNEESETRNLSQSCVTKLEEKEKESDDTSSRSPHKTESLHENEKSRMSQDKIVPSVQHNIVAQNSTTCIDFQYNNKNTPSEDKVIQNANEDIDPIIPTKNTETSSAIEIVEYKGNEMNSANSKSSVMNKFRFLKAKPKLGLNIQTKNRSNLPKQKNNERKQEVENNNKIKDTSHETTDSKLIDEKSDNVDELRTKNDFTPTHNQLGMVERIFEKTSMNKDSSDGEKIKEIKSDNMSISSECNLPQKKILNFKVPILTGNNLESSKSELEFDKSKSLNYPKNKSEDDSREICTLSSKQTTVDTPNISKKSFHIKNEPPKKPSVAEIDKVSPTKTKSLSSYIKQLEHEKLLSSQSIVQPKEDQNQKFSKQRNVIKIENSILPAIKVNEKNIGKVNVKNKDPQMIENKKILGNRIKQIKPRKPVKRVQAKSEGKNISTFINGSMSVLETTRKYEIVTTSSMPNTNNSKNSMDVSEAKLDDEIIRANKNVIELKPIGNIDKSYYVFDPIDCIKSDENCTYVPALDDHMYAKPFSASVSQGNINLCVTETEKNLETVKFKNLCHVEKMLKNCTSKMTGLNPFQKALLLEEIEDDQKSEASKCEARPFIDINSCTFNTGEGNQEETVSKISYPLNERGMDAFSGLSLVTKLIKEENGDPFAEMEPDPLCIKDQITNENYSYYEEEKVYPDSMSTGYYAVDGETTYYEVEVVQMDNTVQIIDTTSMSYIEDKNDVIKHEEKNQNIKTTKRKNVTFNLSQEKNDIDNSLTKNNPNKKPRKSRKIKQENTTNNTNSTKSVELNDIKKVDDDLLKQEIEVDHEYKPENTSMFYSSDSDIDIEEREFVINGRKNTGGKKKVSDSIYLKRQSETLKKIKTETCWKESLTVNDLIFYNPESNPMSNPPDISVVTKSEKILDMKDEKENVLSEEEEAVDNPEPVPQLKISADGKLIIDPKSLIIEETGLKKSKQRIEQSEALLESKYTIKKFANLYTKQKMKRIMNEWGPEDTIMFYRAVNTIGTDFSMMATLFENRTRADIKRKFKLEERKNPTLLSKALRNFNSFDIDELKCELEADKRRVQRIKLEEIERKKMLKEEKKMEKIKEQKSIRRAKNKSMCGQLTQDSSLLPVPEYVKPHSGIIKLLSQSDPLSTITGY